MSGAVIHNYCGESVAVARLCDGRHSLSVSLVSSDGVAFSLPRLLIEFVSRVLSDIGGDYDVIFTPLSSEKLRNLVNILVDISGGETFDVSHFLEVLPEAKILGIELDSMLRNCEEKDEEENGEKEKIINLIEIENDMDDKELLQNGITETHDLENQKIVQKNNTDETINLTHENIESAKKTVLETKPLETFESPVLISTDNELPDVVLDHHGQGKIRSFENLSKPYFENSHLKQIQDDIVENKDTESIQTIASENNDELQVLVENNDNTAKELRSDSKLDCENGISDANLFLENHEFVEVLNNFKKPENGSKVNTLISKDKKLRKQNKTHCCRKKGCGKVFASDTELKAHNHRKQYPEVLECFPCQKSWPGNEYRGRHRYNIHLKKHAMETFDCGCQVPFSGFKERKQHLQIVHMGYKQCVQCKGTYKTEEDLAKHMKLHERDETFRCDECSFTAEGNTMGINRSKLKKHKYFKHFQQANGFNAGNEDRAHKVNPVKCEFCAKIFRGPLLLKKHIIRVHNRITCPECGLTVRDMKRHIASKHTKDKDKSVKCAECGKGFLANYELKHHMMNVHIKSRPYKCRAPECFDHPGFNCSANRSTHERRKHKDLMPAGRIGTQK